MKKFLLKLLYFSLPPLLFVIGIVLFIEKLSRSEKIKTYTFSDEINSKTELLSQLTNSTNIIIAGDSRGERQIIPRILTDETEFNAVNISVTAGELISYEPIISKTKSNDIIIISASSWQINDGALNWGYFSMKGFSELSISEKLKIYNYSISDLFKMYSTLSMCIFKGYYNINNKLNHDSINKGFFAVEKSLDTNKSAFENYLEYHPWYKNLTPKGVRYKLFTESIERLSNTNKTIIFYQPPVSPFWQKNIGNNSINEFEILYSSILDSMCKSKENLIFLDYYNYPIENLTNSHFYDHQHLNLQGAKIFSYAISDTLLKLVYTQEINKFTR